MRAGTAFGGWKTRDAIPMLTDKMMKAKGRPFRHSLRDASAPTPSRPLPLSGPAGCVPGSHVSRVAPPCDLCTACPQGEIAVDHFITHRFNGVGETTKAIDALHSGDCLRAAVHYC